MGVNWIMPELVLQLFNSWWTYGSNDRSKLFGECLIHAIIWGIWRERNNRIFNDKFKSFEKVIEAIIREIGGWMLAEMEFKGLFLSDFLRDWVTVISCSETTTPMSQVVDWNPCHMVCWNLILMGHLKESRTCGI